MISQIGGIIFDSGLCLETCQQQNANFDCRNQIPYSFIIAFNYPFENIPQVFIILDLLSVDVKTDFRVQIKDVTLQNFSLYINCLSGWASCVRIKWYAIDDQRFQIINAFNTINLTQKTYQHKNKNVNIEIGLITLISHNFDEINFKLQIDEITCDNVTVSLTKDPEDFLQQVQVGFQIILGPKEAFQNFLFIVSTNDYVKLIEEKQNAWFISPFIGMGYPYTDAVRLDKQYQFQETSIYKYSLSTWYSAFTPCSHSHGFLSHLISTKYYSLNLQKFEVTQKSQLVPSNQISIHFLQRNQILDSIGEFSVTLDKDLTEIIIYIKIACPQGKLFESNFKKCFDCPIQKLYQQNYKCSNTLKELVFKNQYSKQASAYSELLINIQENLCDMKQIQTY